MPPKQRVVAQSSHRIQDKRGYLSTAYNELTSSDNATVVKSVLIFGVSLFLPYIHRTIVQTTAARQLGQVELSQTTVADHTDNIIELGRSCVFAQQLQRGSTPSVSHGVCFYAL